MDNILICDDDRDIVAALKIYLSGGEYTIFTAFDGNEALKIAKENDIHLILMDIMMPGLDGISAAARLREEYNMPLIFLSAKSEDNDKVLGLSIGADDYITKPFNPVEVLARVKSALRRYKNFGGAVKSPSLYRIGGIELDDEEKSVKVDGVNIHLTPSEYNILKFLMASPGKVYSSSQIYRAIWNDCAPGSESAIAVHVCHLREKIEINPSEPRFLKVVWGRGYKMEKDVK
jgi:DNA-binding response OmpR family regulator